MYLIETGGTFVYIHYILFLEITVNMKLSTNNVLPAYWYEVPVRIGRSLVSKFSLEFISEFTSSSFQSLGILKFLGTVILKKILWQIKCNSIRYTFNVMEKLIFEKPRNIRFR